MHRFQLQKKLQLGLVVNPFYIRIRSHLDQKVKLPLAGNTLNCREHGTDNIH